jgi:hypothetical protein
MRPLFFLKPCIDVFLTGRRPYLAIDIALFDSQI